MNAKHPCLLIVDSESELLEMICDFFRDREWTAVPSESAEHAFDLFQEMPNRFHVVLTDIMDGKKAGLWLVQEIRKLSPHLPVFVFYAGQAKPDPKEIMALGATGVIDKPFSWVELIELLNDAILKYKMTL